MAKTELKTKLNEASVDEFLNTVEDEQKRKDSLELVRLMEKATKQKAKMWGTAIVGFGSYHYKYDSGHEGDMCTVGFSPRKAALTLYLMAGIQQQDLMDKLGKYKTGKGCLYIKTLKDINTNVLTELVTTSYNIQKNA